MNAQDVANTLWGCATLGSAAETAAPLEALGAAAGRVAGDMTPQAVANTLWAYATWGVAPE
eukprot:gene730-4229_t